jgi:hypothetical protein
VLSMGRLSQGWSSRAAALLLFLAAFFVINRGLSIGDDLPRWDAATYFAPAQCLVADHARHGELVRWNPWVHGGSPDGADPQFGAFSPINVLFGLATGCSLEGFRIYWLAMWAVGGIGILLWALGADFPWWSGVLGGLAFTFSGFFVGHAQHTSFIVAASFLTLTLWRLDRALLEARPLFAVQAGGLWGLSALAGYPGLIIMNGFFLALWTLGRVIERPRPSQNHRSDVARAVSGPTLSTAATALSACFLTGVIILLPSYVAFFVEGGGYSDRTASLAMDRVVGDNALHPQAVLTFLSPYVAVLKEMNRELWYYTDISSASIYLSPLLLTLAAVALVSRPRYVWRWWLAAMAMLFLGFAMGRALPLREWLYELFPPSRFFRHAAMLRLYYIVPVIILALYAVGDLCRDLRLGRTRSLRVFVFTSLAMFALAVGATAVLVSTDLATNPMWKRAAFLAALVWLAVPAIAVLTYLLRGSAQIWLPIAVLTVAGIDAVSVVDLSHSIMVARDPGSQRIFSRAASEHRSELTLGAEGFARQYHSSFGIPNFFPEANNLNLFPKKAALLSYTPLSSALFNALVRNQDLASLALGEKRTWFSDSAVRCELSVDALRIYHAKVQSEGAHSLVDHFGWPPEQGASAPCETAPPGAGRLAPVPAQVEDYSPNRLVMNVIAPSEGWVLVTERYAPGWRAKIDGTEVPIHNANFGFRAVQITPGTHRISFRYRPFGYPGLLIASWLLLVVVLVFSVWGPLKRRPGAECQRGSAEDPHTQIAAQRP